MPGVVSPHTQMLDCRQPFSLLCQGNPPVRERGPRRSDLDAGLASNPKTHTAVCRDSERTP